MELFNTIVALVILILILGAITVGMFSAAYYFWKCPQDRLAVIIIYAIPSFVAGMISLLAVVNVIYYWLIPVIF